MARPEKTPYPRSLNGYIRSSNDVEISRAKRIAVGEWWIEFKDILKTVSNEEAEINARAMMTRLVDIVQGLLLMVDAQSDGDETARLVLESWFAEKQDGGSLRAQASRKEQAVSDLKIVFGVDGLQAARSKL